MWSTLAFVLAMTPPDTLPQPVEDTYIDAEMPDSNFGRDGLLLGGPGTAILVRLPGLDWIPRGQAIETAMLTLRLVDDADVRLKSVKRVTVPWSEGNGQRAPLVFKTKNEPTGATWNLRALGGAKWQSAGAQGDTDGRAVPGVNAVSENGLVRITGLAKVLDEMAKNPSKNYGLRIEFESKLAFFSSDWPGQGPTLSTSLTDRPAAGPRFSVLSIDAEGPGAWSAQVQNVGDSPATGWNASWSVNGLSVSSGSTQQAVPPGETVRIRGEFDVQADTTDPRRHLLALEAVPGGASTGDEGTGRLAQAVRGLPVKFALSPGAQAAVDAARGSEPALAYLQRVVSCVNSAVFAQSRTSFAPEGCIERLRLATGDEPALTVRGDYAALGQADTFSALVRDTVRAVSPLYGLWAAPPETATWPAMSVGWIPDTRDDTGWPTALMMPDFPWGEPKPTQVPLFERHGLGRAEVAALNQLVGTPVAERGKAVFKVSPTLILALADLGGAAVSEADVEVFRTKEGRLTTDPLYKLKTNDSGWIVLSPTNGPGLFPTLAPDGSDSWLFVRVTRNFVTQTVWVSATTLIAEYARGNTAAPVVQVRLSIPSGQVKTDEDLATGKSVTDSLGRFPAELNAVVDGDPATAVALEGGAKPNWIEVDLGRDRLIGSVELDMKGGIWEKFEIATARTGGKGSFDVWAAENRGSLRWALTGSEGGASRTLTYSANAVRSRYVRLLVKSADKHDLASLRIRTLAQ